MIKTPIAIKITLKDESPKTLKFVQERLTFAFGDMIFSKPKPNNDNQGIHVFADTIIEVG